MVQGFQKRYLRGLAHHLKPVVHLGQQGMSAGLLAAVNEALELHELIKVRFVDFKEREIKRELAAAIGRETASELVGLIGNLAIFYRPAADEERRRIVLPSR
ncbi:MAG: ribosome assembly RNA-binding protein YhbY [Deltaproteobacteria bacterium]|nr:ribosome assembly RNA-binding protein YhbY [Deltaproteobacteria bacterium]